MQEVFSSIYENMGGVNRNVIEPALRISRIAGRAQEQLARQQMAMFEAYLGCGVKQFQAMAAAKDPQEYFARQAELTAELGEKLIVAVQEVLDIQVQARDEFGSVVKEGLKSVEIGPLAPKSAGRTTAKTEKKAA